MTGTSSPAVARASSFGPAAAAVLGCGVGFAVASIALAARVFGVTGAADAAAGLLVGSAPVAVPLVLWPLLLLRAVRRHARVLAVVVLAAHVVLAMEAVPRARAVMVPTVVDGVVSPETQRSIDATTWTSDDFVVRWGMDPAMARQEALRRLLQLATLAVLLAPLATRRAAGALPWLALAVALTPRALLLAAPAVAASIPLVKVALAAAAVVANEILARDRQTTTGPRRRSVASRRVVVASIAAGLVVGAGVRAGPALRGTATADVATTGERIASSVRTLDGRRVSLESTDREATLVVTWASWCAFCPAQLDRMAALRDELGRDRVRLVALNPEGPQDVRAASAHRFDEATLVAVADPAAPLRVRTGSFPETFLLDSNGRVRAHALGSEREAAEGIARAARQLVGPPP